MAGWAEGILHQDTNDARAVPAMKWLYVHNGLCASDNASVWVKGKEAEDRCDGVT